MDTFNTKRLPEYVFNTLFERFLYVVFSEALVNRSDYFFKAICSVLEKRKSKSLSVYELIDSEIRVIKEFCIDGEICLEITDFLKSYKDENDLPYFILIAEILLFADDLKVFSIYCDREFDICIIGCSEKDYELFQEIYSGVNFESLQDYLDYLRKWIMPDVYAGIEERIKENYGR